ncbi:MAG: glycosyltransferase [Bacteroidales bacterium]|nr:glycosyltransferase [Bacteroidales bacterium]
MGIVYSIIIPHKNIPNLLQRCLDSIPERNDLEVIVVDDNSDPNIVDFEHFPGLGRKNTSVYLDKSGKGAGRARNIGLEHACGKWLLFADADDFFNYCIRDILDEYKDDDADIIFFSTSSVDCETYNNDGRTQYVWDFISTFIDNPQKGENILRYVLGSPWAKMLKRSLVSKNCITFQESTINNDARFSCQTGFYAKEIKADKRALYCVTRRGGSIQYSLTEEKILESVDILAARYIFLKKHDVVLPFSIVWGGREYIERLVDVKCTGNDPLYAKCMQIVTAHGLPEIETETIVKEELKKRKKKRRDDWPSRIRDRVALRTRLRKLFGK